MSRVEIGQEAAAAISPEPQRPHSRVEEILQYARDNDFEGSSFPITDPQSGEDKRQIKINAGSPYFVNRPDFFHILQDPTTADEINNYEEKATLRMSSTEKPWPQKPKAKIAFDKYVALHGIPQLHLREVRIKRSVDIGKGEKAKLGQGIIILVGETLDGSFRLETRININKIGPRKMHGYFRLGYMEFNNMSFKRNIRAKGTRPNAGQSDLKRVAEGNASSSGDTSSAQPTLLTAVEGGAILASSSDDMTKETPPESLRAEVSALPEIAEDKRLVPDGFIYGPEQIKAEALKAVDGPRYEGYPEAGLHMSDEEYDVWEKGDPANGIPPRDATVLYGTPEKRPPYYIEHDKNRYELGEHGEQLKKGAKLFEPPYEKVPADWDIASDGSPLHPLFRYLVTKSRQDRGIVTGPGFYYHEGVNETSDPVILWYDKREGVLKALLVKGRDNRGWALPGGHVDAEDKALSTNKALVAAIAALREAGEEAGATKLSDSPRVVVLEDSPVGDWRLTANAGPFTSVVAIFPDDATARAIEVKASSDAAAAQWQVVGQTPLFASHDNYLRLGIQAWQERTGLVVGTDGKVGIRPTGEKKGGGIGMSRAAEVRVARPEQASQPDFYSQMVAGILVEIQGAIKASKGSLRPKLPASFSFIIQKDSQGKNTTYGVGAKIDLGPNLHTKENPLGIYISDVRDSGSRHAGRNTRQNGQPQFIASTPEEVERLLKGKSAEDRRMLIKALIMEAKSRKYIDGRRADQLERQLGIDPKSVHLQLTPEADANYEHAARLQEELMQVTRKALATENFVERNQMITLAVAELSAQLAVEALASDRSFSVDPEALSFAFGKACFDAGEPFGKYFDQKTGRPLDSARMKAKYYSKEGPMKAARGAAQKYLFDALEAVGIDTAEFTHERVGALLERARGNFYHSMDIAMHQLGVDVSSNWRQLTPDQIKYILEQTIHIKEKPNYIGGIAGLPFNEQDAPLSPTELRILDVFTRLTQATWLAGQVHRAKYEGDPGRANPDARHLYMLYDYMLGHNFRRHGITLDSLTSLALVEVYKDIATSSMVRSTDDLVVEFRDQEKVLEGYARDMQSYIMGRRIQGQLLDASTAKELAELIIEVVYGQEDEPDDKVLRRLRISRKEFNDYAAEAPLVQIGSIEHESWKRDFPRAHPGDDPRKGWWKPLNYSSKANDIAWREAVEELERNNHGQLPVNIRRGEGRKRDEIEVDILHMTFAEMPPSRQSENIESARVAWRWVNRMIREGKREDLDRCMRVLEEVLIGNDKFYLLGESGLESLHEVGNEIHVEWIKRNPGTANYLTKQTYRNILLLALGREVEGDVIPEGLPGAGSYMTRKEVWEEIKEGAMKDNAFKEAVREEVRKRSDRGVDIDIVFREELIKYAQSMALEALKPGASAAVDVLKGSAQGNIKLDFHFVELAKDHNDEMDRLSGK